MCDGRVMTAKWLGVELDQLLSAAGAGIDREDADEAQPLRQSRAQANSGALGSIGYSAAMPPGLPMSITPFGRRTPCAYRRPAGAIHAKLSQSKTVPAHQLVLYLVGRLTLLSGIDNGDRTPGFAP